MELYIVDNKTLDILSVSNVCDYNLNLDEETNGVSEFILPALNNAKKDCYIVLNGLYKQFLFVINDDVIATKNQKSVEVSALDISNIFDRKIILKDKEKMQKEGIETFIADNILENFANTNDSILNLDYIEVYIHSNTKAIVTINEEDGLYNFHTFLINCRQYKNIYTDFSIVNKKLRIDIGYKQEETMLIDTTLAEVTNYNKIYEVDPVTKVEAYIREDGSVYNLYLKSDRTTTTNKNDPDRLYGRVETISCENLETAKEETLNTIRANTYTHLVEFSIAKTSKLIDISKLYLGRQIKIKTEDSIYDSYISAIMLNDENFVSFKSGNLRIDFTDKQRQQKRSGTVGTKIDKSGGNITGALKVQGKEVATEEYVENATKTIMTRQTGKDLNDYVEDGTYYFSTSYTPLHVPIGTAGWLKVMRGGSSNFAKQIWFRHGTNNTTDFETFTRMLQTNGGWSNWKQFSVVSERKAYTITSDDFEFYGDNIRNCYIQDGNKVTLFINLKTKTALTAKTKYEFAITVPKPANYMGTTGGFMGEYCGANVFITPGQTIRIFPYANVTSGKEFNAQLTYFTS